MQPCLHTTPTPQAPALCGHSPATPEKLPPPRPCKRINSQQLLADEREIEIEHVGQLYRLRITALGKLILTK